MAPKAIAHLRMSNEVVEFDARFSGVSHHLFIPVRAITALYAFENGCGMAFSDEDDDGGDLPPPPSQGPSSAPTGPAKKPSLKIVK